MRRYLLVVGVGLSMYAQTGRDSYRQAYDAWQQVLANLERNAGTGKDEQIAQAGRASAAAKTFETARAAYLKSSGEDAARRRQLLQTPSTHLTPDAVPPMVADLAAGELQTVSKTVTRFANDPDRGIQQLRQALERERVALAALITTIDARKNAVATVSETTAALEQARVKTAEAFGSESSQLSQALSQVGKESAAWTDYYGKLSSAMQLPLVNGANADVVVLTPGVSYRSSLVRYVGAWDYPIVNGIFHGPQPESIELEIHEKDGHADGTLSARFKPSPGSTVNSVLNFTFEGEFAANPTQRFKLMTSDGAQGTLELIPGPAFNLLEVNFQTDPQPNKIRLGNFILVKK